MAVGGDHERDGAQELEKAENEENNAGERGDGQYCGCIFFTDYTAVVNSQGVKMSSIWHFVTNRQGK
jgi:hypothetical protein